MAWAKDFNGNVHGVNLKTLKEKIATENWVRIDQNEAYRILGLTYPCCSIYGTPLNHPATTNTPTGKAIESDNSDLILCFGSELVALEASNVI